jgi:hypothetical protein
LLVLNQLPSGFWHTFLIKGVPGNGKHIFLARYEASGISKNLVWEVSSKDTWDKVIENVPNMSSAAIALLGTLLGALIGGGMAARRDRMNAKIEWRKFIVEKFGNELRTFQNRVKGTLDPATLRTYFSQLESSAFVGPAGKSFQNFLTAIEKTSNPVDKAKAREDFLVEFERLFFDIDFNRMK